MVELKVQMDCRGCVNRVRKALKRLKGVHNVDIDMGKQKVTVTGWATEERVLEALRKTGKRAEPWPMPYNCMIHNFDHYYQQHETFFCTSNPVENRDFWNGRITREYTYDPHPMLNGEADNIAVSIFSEDNPRACSIM
ncbi:hypothetical protein Ancab_005410 [Ancistrocladus abbreviatus]